MDRRSFLARQPLALGLALAGVASTVAHAQPAKGVVIAIPIKKAANQSDKAVLDAIRTLAAFLTKSPGFIEGHLLKATFADTPFDYLDVTRWEARDNWERLFTDKAFLDLMQANKAFTIRAAEVFTPVAL